MYIVNKAIFPVEPGEIIYKGMSADKGMLGSQRTIGQVETWGEAIPFAKVYESDPFEYGCLTEVYCVPVGIEAGRIFYLDNLKDRIWNCSNKKLLRWNDVSDAMKKDDPELVKKMLDDGYDFSCTKYMNDKQITIWRQTFYREFCRRWIIKHQYTWRYA